MSGWRASKGRQEPLKGWPAAMPGKLEAALSAKHASVMVVAEPPLEPASLIRKATVSLPASLTRIVSAPSSVPLCEALTQTVRVVGVHVGG